MFFHAHFIACDYNLSQGYAMYLEINKYHLFTLRIHTTILSKGGKVMYELAMLNSKLFERASIPSICYID
jgi:hypothetical protein